MSLNSKWILVALLSLSLLIGFSGSCDRDFSTRGEGREALVIQNMFFSGDWILPHGYGNTVPSKPPALHWFASLASMFIGDVTEFTARLPSFISMVLFTLFFYLFLEKRYDYKVAFLSSLILLTSFEWVRAATNCRVDMVLSSTFAGGLIALFVWYENKLVKISILSILLFAMATLAKGPVAILLPAMIFTLFLFANRVAHLNIIISLIKVFLPALVLSSVWYLAAYYEGGDSFLQKVYFENFQRFLGTSEEEPHKHSVFYLFAMVPLGTLPWSLIYIPILLSRECRVKIFEKVKNWGCLSQFSCYSLIVVVCSLVFFSIPSSKRGVYLLPMYPFLSLLIAKTIIDFITKSEKIAKILTHSLITIISILCVVGFIAVIFSDHVDTQKVQYLLSKISSAKHPDYKYIFTQLSSAYGMFEIFQLFILLLLGLFFLRYKDNYFLKWSIKFGLFVGLLISVVSWCLVRPISNITSPRKAAQDLTRLVVSDAELLSYKNSFYGLSFYLKRPMRMLMSEFPDNSLVVMYENETSNFIKSLAINQRFETIYISSNVVEDLSRRLLVARIITKDS